jgi:hypothetical protein
VGRFDASLVVAPYRWEGRWLASTSTTIAGATTGGATVLSASSPNLFAALAGNSVYSFFAPDPRLPDGWIAGTASLGSLKSAGNAGYQLAAGDSFVAVTCKPSGSLFRIDFESLSWSTPQAVTTTL